MLERARTFLGFALAVGVALCPSRLDAQDAEPSAVVLTVGAQSPALLPRAQERGGARWIGAQITPRAAADPAEPREALEALRTSFVEVNFARCLAAAQSVELNVDRLLAEGHREAAATVLATASICAFQSGDLAVARSHLERAVAAELEVGEPLAIAPPELQQLAAAAERESTDAGTVSLRLRTRPAGARLAVDGRALGCDEPQCHVQLRRGAHVITAQRTGYLRRVLELELTSDEEREVALDPAPSSVLRAQLAAALAEGTSPDDVRLAEVAADAYATQVVLLTWTEGERVRAALYDRRHAERGIVARASADRSDPVPAIDEVVSAWLDLRPTPLVEEPLFWILLGLGAAAVAAATATIIVLQPEPQLNLVAR